MSEPKWTTTRPTEPGLYWWHHSGYTDIAEIAAFPKLDRVVYGNGGLVSPADLWWPVRIEPPKVEP